LRLGSFFLRIDTFIRLRILRNRSRNGQKLDEENEGGSKVFRIQYSGFSEAVLPTEVEAQLTTSAEYEDAESACARAIELAKASCEQLWAIGEKDVRLFTGVDGAHVRCGKSVADWRVETVDEEDSFRFTKHWRNCRTGQRTFSWYTAMAWATSGDDVEAWLPDGLAELIPGSQNTSTKETTGACDV